MNIENNKYEKWFVSLGQHIISKRWFYIFLITIITILSGLGLEKMKYDTSIENWFLEGSEVFANKAEYEDSFGNSDIVAIHLQAEDVFDPAVINILDELGKELASKVPFADDVISIADVEYSFTNDDEIITKDLIPDDHEVSELETYRKRALSKEYFINKIVSEDCTETWLVLDLFSYPDEYEEEHGLAPENAVGEKVNEILNQEKYQSYNLRSVGTPVYGYEELLFTGAETDRLLSITIIVLLIFLAITFRSVQGVVIPFTTAIVSIIIVYGIMGHLNIKMNAFLFAIPIILSLAISLGYSVHLFNYYQRSITEMKSRKLAVALAIGKAGLPSSFAAFTTIAALLSFMSIALIPIRWLGLTSAVMIFVILVVVFVLTGALMSFGKDPKNIQSSAAPKSDKYFSSLGQFVLNNSKKILVGFSVIIVIMIFGLFNFEVNFDTERSYGRSVPYIDRMVGVAETKIGSFDSYNITLDFGEEQKVKEPEILNKFDLFVNHVNKLNLTNKTNSLLDYLKDMNRLVQGNKQEYYKIPESKNLVAQLLMLYEMSGGSKLYDWVNDDFSVIRLEVETNNMNAKQTMLEMEELDNRAKELFPEAEFNITGGMPKLAALNMYVAVGQIQSLIIALIVIGVLVMIVLGGIKIGLIGMIPNITPIIIIGGTMGLLGIPLDFMTVTIAPMILGIAVDNTIHLINYLKGDYQKTSDYYESSVNALKAIGRALFITSFLIIISFLIYLTSPINMMVYLGAFIALGIFSALLSNLILTPIIVNHLRPFGNNSLTGKKL